MQALFETLTHYLEVTSESFFNKLNIMSNNLDLIICKL